MPDLPANKLQPSVPGAPVAVTAVPAVIGGGGRSSVIQLSFKDRGSLYAAYIPMLLDGGIFVPTPRDFRLGEDVYLLLTLPDDSQRYPVAGKVAWLTPPNASGGRSQGVGVRFPADEKTRQIKLRIEESLGTGISSSKPTQTI